VPPGDPHALHFGAELGQDCISGTDRGRCRLHWFEDGRCRRWLRLAHFKMKTIYKLNYH